MREQRKYIRQEAPIIVTYRIESKQALVKKTLLNDIAEGGLRFPVFEQLPPGTILHLALKLSSADQPVSAQGEVVWAKPRKAEITGGRFYVLGVKFIKIAAGDREKIGQLKVQ